MNLDIFALKELPENGQDFIGFRETPALQILFPFSARYRSDSLDSSVGIG